MIEWIEIATTGRTPVDFFMGLLLPMFSVLGVFLSTSRNEGISRLGFACGICSQPVWFYFAITSFNLGMFINSLFFTLLWIYRLMQSVPNLPTNKT